ncbi:hypothetical protein [Micromonospora arida]
MPSDQATPDFSIKPTLLSDGDDWVDATVMSILAPEWAEHRGHPERR